MGEYLQADSMKTIEKKIWSEYFNAVANGDKNFELRLADWDIEVGDTLILKDWNPEKKEYTGRQIVRKVTYLVKTKGAEDWGMWPKEDIENYGFQIIGFRPEGTNAEDSFHLGIKALIRNSDGKALLLKVNKEQLKGYSGEAYWDIAGGRIHKNSTVEETLRREVEEETG